MDTFFGKALVAVALVVPAGGALAAEQASERRAIDARVVKIQLDGIINLRVKQGATPSLVLHGERDQLAKVSVTQQGDTLRIDTEKQRFHFGRDNKEMRAELTLPNLNEFTSRGVGSSELHGFSGNDIKLTLDGAGSLTVNSTYKAVVARLGDVGSMTLHSGESDKIDLTMRGAGHIAVNGHSRLLRADMGGVGGLDAKKLRADSVELTMSGLGGASVFASNSASLNLNGLGSATVYGKPPRRHASARGLGSVAWD